MDSENPQSETFPPSRRVSWWRRIANRFWGYDFFISYHWSSGGAYAVKLAEALRKRRFDCFLDRSEFAGGDDWKHEARQALANTQRLIVVGTREALSVSNPVRDEVSIFSTRSHRIIPILFGERIPDDQRHQFPTLNLISNQVVEILEDEAHLETGPSHKVLDDIDQAHRILRRRRLRTLVVAGVNAILLIAALVASISFLTAEKQRNIAQTALVESQRELSRNLIDRGLIDADNGDRAGMLRLARAYEVAHRVGPGGDSDIPIDEAMSRSARRLLAGRQASIGLGLLQEDGIHRADLSPTGTMVRTEMVNIDGEPIGYEFWDASSGRPLGIRIGTDDAFPRLFMSPDWSTAIHWNGAKLRRWNLGTGAMVELKLPPGEAPEGWEHPPPPDHSLNGRWAVKPNADVLELWNMETGERVHTVTPMFGKPGRLRFSKDSRTLVVLSAKGKQFELFDTPSGRSLGAPVNVSLPISKMRIANGSRSIAVVLDDGSVRLWNNATRELHAPTELFDTLPDVEFSPEDGILIVYNDHTVALVDPQNGNIRGELRHVGRIGRILFSPDGTAIATTDGKPRERGQKKYQSNVTLWKTQTAQRRFQFRRTADASEMVEFSPNGSLLAAAHEKGFDIYDVQSGRRHISGPATGRSCLSRRTIDGVCRRMAFSPDGRTLYTLKWQQRVARLVHSRLPELVLNHPAGTSAAALSPDAKRLLTGDRDGRVQLWDVVKKAALTTPSDKGPPVHGALFTRGGNWAVTNHLSSEYRIWDAATGLPITPEFEFQDKKHRSVLMLGEGGNLMMVRGDAGLLWDFEAKAPGKDTMETPIDVNLFLFSNDRRLHVSASYGSDILLWDVPANRGIRTLNPHSSAVQDLHESESVVAMAFSPDNASLVAATSYGTMRVWDVGTGELAVEMEGPTGSVDQACFSPDGEVIASLHSGKVRLWDVFTGRLIQEVNLRQVRSLAFSKDGKDLFMATPMQTYRWSVPHLPDQLERIRAWVEVLSLASWSEQDTPAAIGHAALLETWERLDRQGGPLLRITVEDRSDAQASANERQ